MTIAAMLVGALIGWVACRVLGGAGRRGLLLNTAAGVLGAGLAAPLLGPVFAGPARYESSVAISSLVVALFGAIALVALLRLVLGLRSH